MRRYLASLTVVFGLGLALTWGWGVQQRLTYLSRDYAILEGKQRLIDGYSRPGLAVFGDSVVMDGVEPVRLGPDVINCATGGSTPIESYFLIRRLLKAPARPKAVLLSFDAFHFVHPDFYWENTVKFGLVSGPEADEVLGLILRTRDPELLVNPGLWDLQLRLYSFLLSRGFPSYYLSSFFAEPYGVRKKENLEALKVVAQTRGQYYFPLANGSKSLNKDTQLKSFTPSPVVDHYFGQTLALLRKENIPVYFYAMPINESSVPHLDPKMCRAFRDYLEAFTRVDPQFHILSRSQTVYPWRLFSDYAHLNEKGTLRFNREFARVLNQARVPGGPYGVSMP